MADRRRMIDRHPLFLVNERALARFPDAVRHHIHRPLQRNLRPFFGARRAIFHLRFAPIVGEQLIRSRALRTKIPLADRTLWVALDRNQFAVLVINELSATDAAVWADGSRNL